MSSLFQRYNIVVPLILAVFLPLLGLFTDGLSPPHKVFFQKWTVSFLMIFLMWYSFLSINTHSKSVWSFKNIATIALLVLVITIVFNLYGISEEQQFNRVLPVRILFTAIIIFMVQKGLLTQERLADLRVDKERLQTENLRIQLKELRNQMDPHFFFNSLSTLRAMVRQNHVNSEQFIIGLSAFYRQMLKIQEEGTLPLSKEIEIIKSYIFIMSNRNENALLIDFEAIDEAYYNHQIPTLALQSVVENCIKHNAISEKMPLEIGIRTTNDAYIEVKNRIQPKLSTPESSGMGLELLKKRYKLMGITDGVMVSISEKEFIVKLKLISPQ
ncbi:MAG TPA: histidine kinase [Saprospiraceae bacterium]|nr:histidine kinase [Saprospiraceae bacterium]HMQ84621.1 histidine kinase [Saprospiraceae bacterium]